MAAFRRIPVARNLPAMGLKLANFVEQVGATKGWG